MDSEDTTMVRTIERVLGTQLERRTVANFDYSTAAPKKDSEFARPPRQPAPRRKPDSSHKGGNKERTAGQSGSIKTTALGRPSQQSGKPAHASTAPPRFNRQRRAG